MENVSVLNAMLQAASMQEQPTYNIANDLPKIFGLPRRKVQSMVRSGQLPCLEINRKIRIITHDMLAAVVQKSIRLAANDEN